MPSTYTVNLGIEKPATGEQSGTWGDTTNVNFDIIDQAVNGSERVTLTTAGTSGSPNDLSIVNGSTTSSEGRNKWIEIYSAADLGGSAYVRLVPNDAEKILFIRNSLAGGQSVLLFQGTYNASNDLEIPAGVDMVVKFDGGGAGATVTDVFTKLRATEITTPTLTAGTADINDGTVEAVVGGTTPKAGTFTNLTANTNLTINSSTTVDGILDEDNMSSDSDTKLATQQSIKAYVDSQVAAQDTLSEILANGNTSGSNNLIIDNGQALTANTISETTAGSGVTIDGVLLKDSDVTVAEKIIHSGDTNTFIGFPAADTFTVETAGTERVRVDASGNVGIGTTSPDSKVHAVSSGLTRIRSETTGTATGERAIVGVKTPAQSFGASLIATNSNETFYPASAVGLFTADAQPLWFGTSNAERMRIDSSGNVGIGTSNPDTLGGGGALVVNRSGGARIVFNSVSRPYVIRGDSGSDDIRFTARGSSDTVDVDLATLTVAGNLGLGTTSPVEKLNLYQASGAFGIRLQNANTGATINDGAFFTLNASSALEIGTDDNTPVQFFQNGSERMRIDDATGNVGIGTTSPTTTLDVNGDVTITDKIIHAGDTNTAIRFPAADTFTVETGGSERVRVDSSGNVGIGTNAPSAPLHVLHQSTTTPPSTSDSAGILINGGIAGAGAGGEIRFAAFSNFGFASIKGYIVDAASNSLGYLDTYVRSAVTDSSMTLRQRITENIIAWFDPAGSEAMRITSTGNVGIGTTSPATLLHVDGTIRYTNRPAAGTITALGFDTNGDLKASSSSLRYKHDIQDYGKGLAVVMQLRPVSFKFNGEDITNIGFIAEEVDALGMTEVMLYDAEDRPEGIQYANMVSLLTKAIQEQQNIIDDLRARVAELEAKT